MRILLAEDERELSNALTEILKHNRYSVDQAFDGEEAINFLDTGEYDCIILDIMMPKKNGIEVLKKLRMKNDKTPVIILTAKSQVDDKVLGLDSGADDYITKPFNSKELLARIRVMSRRKIGKADNRLKLGNTELDIEKYLILTESGETELNNKEFQIIEMLIRNSSIIISQDKIFENIWGLDTDTEMNTIWVYISNIRKKLNSINSNLEIKTIRNIGYKLEIKND